MNKFKSTLIKLTAGAALALTGAVAINTTAPVQHVDAASATLKTKDLTIDAEKGTKIWTSYYKGTDTGKVAKYGDSYKYDKSAIDTDGNLWFRIGKKQWVKADDTVMGTLTTAEQKAAKKAAKKAKKAKKAANNAETAAKNWIAMRESGNNYNARNGQYIGKYQLTAAYLKGDYSPANQERVANNYVKSRYGSWVNAKNFWLRNGWY